MATWEFISPTDDPPAARRFESIAVDPNDPNHVYAGTSELVGSPQAKIYDGRLIGGNWQWTPLTLTMAPRAWADQYRVRDIQFCTGPAGGCWATAYAVIEGGGIYALTSSAGLAPRRR
jgi:hypothetical protein